MPYFTYTIELDTGRDNTYGSDIDDITTHVIQGNSTAGMQNAYDEFSQPSSLNLLIDNRTKAFLPEITGDELVTNGNFSSWSGDNPSGWTVTGESGSDPEVSETATNEVHGGTGTGACNLYSTGATVSIAQTILTVGTSYKVAFSLTNNASGAIAVYNGSTRVSVIYHIAGLYTFYFNATDTSIKVQNIGDETCDLTIDDFSVKATPLYAGIVRPGTMLRLKATYNGTTKTLYQGKIAKGSKRFGIQPMSGNVLGQSVSMTASDAMIQLLDAADYIAPLLIDTTPDQPIQRLFDDGIIRWPYANAWVLDAQGNSELGITTTLYEHDVTSLETGITELDYAGDFANRGTGVNAQTYIRDMVSAEMGGRFYYQPRDGQFVFINRHHDIQTDTSLATYTTDMFLNMDYVYGDDLVNDVTIIYNQRRVGDPGTVIWALENVPLRLTAGTTRSFSVRYQDPDNPTHKIGATGIIPPVPSIDVHVLDSEDADGEIIPLNASADLHANNGRLSITNSTGVDAWIHRLQVRATPLIWVEDSVHSIESTSTVQNDKYPRVIEVRAVSDVNLVQDYADLIVRKFGNPVARIGGVTFKATQDTTSIVAARDRTIGDRITITDDYTAHDADYVIVGESHQFDAQSGNHLTSWVLKPITQREIYWELETAGKSELDRTTVLVF